MKRVILTLILANLMLIFANVAFAQTAKITGVQGEVLVKTDANVAWQKAEVNALLGKDVEIKTKSNSSCTLAFDKEEKNIVSIKENTQIKIEEVSPAKVNLSEGRVFSLINNLSAQEEFQIRTPVAIAAARGTGWVTGHHAGASDISCFDDNVHIECREIPEENKGMKDLASGFKLDIKEGCVFGDIRPLENRDYNEWDDFTDYLDSLGEGGEEAAGGPETGIPDDLRDEQQEDYGTITGEGRRQTEEGGGGGNYSGPE